MATPVRNHKSTHTGLIENVASKRRIKVKLSEEKAHWGTPTGLLFRKSDGIPRGQTETATWVLVLDSIQPV
jgi:hypothetical protein